MCEQRLALVTFPKLQRISFHIGDTVKMILIFGWSSDHLLDLHCNKDRLLEPMRFLSLAGSFIIPKPSLPFSSLQMVPSDIGIHGGGAKGVVLYVTREVRPCGLRG